MIAKTNEQAAVNAVKRTERRERQGPKKVVYITSTLACSRCPAVWHVVDLNPERKVVFCPVDGEPNDIREAVRRGM